MPIAMLLRGMEAPHSSNPGTTDSWLVGCKVRCFVDEVWRQVDVRLPGKGNSNSHGARPVHQIISMIKWIRTSRLSIKNSVSGGRWSEAQQTSATPAAVERAIAQAQASGTLNLTSRNLLEVPPELCAWNEKGQSDKWWEMVQLSKLDLSHNELRHLPEELFEALDSLQVALKPRVE